jgi:hypothetical protein
MIKVTFVQCTIARTMLTVDLRMKHRRKLAVLKYSRFFFTD